MKKWIFLSFMITSFPALADRYGLYDDPSRYGSSSYGGGKFAGSLVLIAGFLWSLYFIESSLSERRLRIAKGIKPQPIMTFGELLGIITGYLIVSLFLSLPIFWGIKFIEGSEYVREIWYWVVGGISAYIYFIRRT